MSYLKNIKRIVGNVGGSFEYQSEHSSDFNCDSFKLLKCSKTIFFGDKYKDYAVVNWKTKLNKKDVHPLLLKFDESITHLDSLVFRGASEEIPNGVTLFFPGNSNPQRSHLLDNNYFSMDFELLRIFTDFYGFSMQTINGESWNRENGSLGIISNNNLSEYLAHFISHTHKNEIPEELVQRVLNEIYTFS